MISKLFDFPYFNRGDAKILNDVQERFDVNITELPDEIDLSSYSKFNLKCFSSGTFVLINEFFFLLQTVEGR